MRFLTPLLLLAACKSTPPASQTDEPTPTDTDVPFTCTDDEEPNDDLTTNARLDGPTAASLSTLDDDYFQIEIPPGQRADVTVSTNDTVDIDAELLFNTGSVIDSSTEPPGTTEALQTYSLLDVPQTVLLRTFLAAGAADEICTDYVLDVDFSCSDDGDVPNDRSDAQAMGIGDAERGQVAGADMDWYAFDVAGGEHDRVLINFAGSAGSLDWEVWLDDSPDQMLQSGTATHGFPLVLNNADFETLTFYVGVTHSTGGCNLYDLVVED